MENLRETLDLLYQLQSKDIEIFKLEKNITQTPKIIEKKQ